MPNPGDQHRENAATVNPFAEQRTNVAQYTAQEIATLQSRLDKQLGPEYISTRPGNGGGKVHYIAAEKVIQLANEVFGFNGWSSQIQNVQIDFVDENAQTGKITLGLSTIVRVTLRDGSFHEDIGYGHIENCKGKAAAFEKAKKEATTDALKRALRNFGNVLGNCLYDKEYLKRVEKIKVAPSRWDAVNLHRHPDFAPITKPDPAPEGPVRQEVVPAVQARAAQLSESFGAADFDDEFGSNLLDETDFTHPDEVRVDDTTVSTHPSPAKKAITGPTPKPAQAHPSKANSGPPGGQPNAQPVQPPPSLQQLQRSYRPPPPRPAHLNQPHPDNGQAAPEMQKPNSFSSNSTIADPQAQQQQNANGPAAVTEFDADGFPIPRDLPPGCPDGFVSSRSTHLQRQPIPFNPHAEGQSIRRTHGVNPGKSAPIPRQALEGARGASPKPGNGGGPNTPGNTTPMRTNFTNPATDPTRRIGMPPSGGISRTHFKPPSAATGLKRAPLNDISNSFSSDGNGDAKKAKTDGDPKMVQEGAGNDGQAQVNGQA